MFILNAELKRVSELVITVNPQEKKETEQSLLPGFDLSAPDSNIVTETASKERRHRNHQYKHVVRVRFANAKRSVPFKSFSALCTYMTGKPFGKHNQLKRYEISAGFVGRINAEKLDCRKEIVSLHRFNAETKTWDLLFTSEGQNEN